MHAVDCSDADSDDDLIPYAMDDDPDASEVAAPRYLRTLMQGEGREGREGGREGREGGRGGEGRGGEGRGGEGRGGEESD